MRWILAEFFLGDAQPFLVAVFAGGRLEEEEISPEEGGIAGSANAEVVATVGDLAIEVVKDGVSETAEMLHD